MNQYYYRNLKDNGKIIRVYENEAPDWNEWEQISDREAQQSARIAELEAAILNIGQVIDRETYANVKAAILDAVKIAKGN